MLVERGEELAALAAAVGDATRVNGAGAAGRLVLVSAAAGIGKTSLLSEAGRLGRAAGARVATGRGTELERQFSFAVVRQWFEPLLGALGENERDALLAGAAGPAGTVLGVAGPLAPPVGDFAALHGLYWLTANLCERRPLVLLADDLHWTDRGSLRFLAYLLPRLSGLPLAVVAATRPHEPGAAQRLLDLLSADPACTVLRPAGLSRAGSARVLGDRLDRDDIAPAFAAACHTATGGNPLLLTELARAVVADGLAPTGDNAARVEELGAHALSTRVRARLAQLPPDCAALCEAVAVGGDGIPLELAAAMAGLPAERAERAAGQLRQVGILTREPQPGIGHEQGAAAFVHPLIRTAVYGQLDSFTRWRAHARAAGLLADAGADPEHVATHLLNVPPAGDGGAVDLLRRAADSAMRRGAPEPAVAYLERGVQEPPAEADRLAVLETLGLTAMLVDAVKAATYLGEARRLAEEPLRRAVLTDALGAAMFLTSRHGDGAAAYQEALAELPEEHAELRRQLQANLINVSMAEPATYRLADQLASELRDREDGTGLGHRMLDGVIAFHDALALVTPATAGDRALRCLADGTILEQPSGAVACADAYMTLTAADRVEVEDFLDNAVKRAIRDGSMLGLFMAKLQRAAMWYCRGELAEAEGDARDACQLVDVAQLDVGRPQAAAFLADTVLEQGRMADAQSALEWAGAAGGHPQMTQEHWLRDSRARFLLAQGRVAECVPVILECGAGFSAVGWRNPAMLAWRSTAALALHRLARTAEARALADEQLDLARQWAAPRALGNALRVAGLVHGGGTGLALLREAVDVLAPSWARLEYAKALIDLGACLRRHGLRADAKSALAGGLDLAERCGAVPLARRAYGELDSLGDRPRRAGAGRELLTPAERRVAALAAAGLGNRDIAQELFVTVKTVELHLGSVYRKLGISGRQQLARQLAGAGPS